MHSTKRQGYSFSLPYVLSTSSPNSAPTFSCKRRRATFAVINTLFTIIVMSTVMTIALVNAQMDPFSSLPASVPHLSDSTASSRFNDAEDAVTVSTFTCICSSTNCDTLDVPPHHPHPLLLFPFFLLLLTPNRGSQLIINSFHSFSLSLFPSTQL